MDDTIDLSQGTSDKNNKAIQHDKVLGHKRKVGNIMTGLIAKTINQDFIEICNTTNYEDQHAELCRFTGFLTGAMFADGITHKEKEFLWDAAMEVVYEDLNK